MKTTKNKIILGIVIVSVLFILDVVFVFIADVYHKKYYSITENIFCEMGAIHNDYGIMTEDNTCNYCAKSNSCGEYGCLPRLCP